MKLILEAELDERFNKALDKLQTGALEMKKLVSSSKPADFVQSQRTALVYLEEEIKKMRMRMSDGT